MCGGIWYYNTCGGKIRKAITWPNVIIFLPGIRPLQWPHKCTLKWDILLVRALKSLVTSSAICARVPVVSGHFWVTRNMEICSLCIAQIPLALSSFIFRIFPRFVLWFSWSIRDSPPENGNKEIGGMSLLSVGWKALEKTIDVNLNNVLISRSSLQPLIWALITLVLNPWLLLQWMEVL